MLDIDDVSISADPLKICGRVDYTIRVSYGAWITHSRIPQMYGVAITTFISFM